MELLVMLAAAFALGYALRRTREPPPSQVIYVHLVQRRNRWGKVIVALLVLGLVTLIATV